MPADRGLAGLMSRRGTRPQGRRPGDTGPTQARRTLEESQAHERMNPPSSPKTGAGIARKTITVRQKWRGIGGCGVTRKRRYDGTHNTLQGSQLHERLPSAR